MKYKATVKQQQGEYLAYYHVLYETAQGHQKCYEMVSRDPSIGCQEDLFQKQAEAVILILHDVSGEKILLNHEFRMAVGEWVYNFPAGLIDAGETAAQAAARELREETGLHLVSVDDTWPESYSAVGLSNEKGVVIVGTADGTFGQSHSDMEEIQAGWYTREQVQHLLQRERFAARTQAYCILWSRMR